VIFAALMIIGLGLTPYAISADVTKPGTWLIDPAYRNAIWFALGVVPFAGIAALWFIGVVRSRLREQEDKFFASVFLGSGLLFVGTLFSAEAITGALVESVSVGDISSETYYFGSSISDLLLNLFAMKMAGVFMFSTCTLGLRTAIVPR
jgi:hypothetical protein